MDNQNIQNAGDSAKQISQVGQAESIDFGSGSITIEKDAISSAIISGNGNRVVIYQYHVDRQIEEDRSPRAGEIGPNPYKGLLAFQETDGDRFFGRSKQIEQLWHKFRSLHEEDSAIRLLPIYGPSGSGKSSLARAGLIPELARRPLPGYAQARVAVLVPGTHPLEALASVLARVATDDPTPVAKTREFAGELERANQEEEYDGLRRIADVLPDIAVSPLIVLVDQLEEVYSLCENLAERDAFIGNLLTGARERSRHVSVIVTLRSDFLGETQKHPVLNRLFAQQGFLVPTMDEEELRQAIGQPAELAGHPLDKATIELLIKDTEGREGALPLLQFALTRIWEGLAEGKEPAATLKAIGGVGGALAGEAQRIYSSLNDKDKDIARRVFIGLVEIGEGTRDTRRRAIAESLTAAQDNATSVRKVIGRFAVPGARLLTLSSVEEKEVVEVTHEALLDHWQQIREWLDGQRDHIRQQRRINALAEEWKKQGKKRGYLLQGRQLDDACTFQKRYVKTLSLNECAEEFVRKSLRQRWFSRAAIASFLILPVLVVNGFLREMAVRQDYTTLDSENISGKPEAVTALIKGCSHLQSSPSWLNPAREQIFGACRTLEHRNLENTNLSHANLSHANLIDTNLNHANLIDTNLSHANLSASYLRSANLSIANLSTANLSNANLDKANLSTANLSNANLSNAILPTANLKAANLNNANLSAAILVAADLSNANLSNANLSNANLDGAILLATDLSKSIGLEQLQLTNPKNSPLLCNTKLPAELKLSADRDCDRLPQLLLERNPNAFSNLEEAKQYVEVARKP